MRADAGATIGLESHTRRVHWSIGIGGSPTVDG
jgi:hypothetical protein